MDANAVYSILKLNTMHTIIDSSIVCLATTMSTSVGHRFNCVTILQVGLVVVVFNDKYYYRLLCLIYFLQPPGSRFQKVSSKYSSQARFLRTP